MRRRILILCALVTAGALALLWQWRGIHGPSSADGPNAGDVATPGLQPAGSSAARSAIPEQRRSGEALVQRIREEEAIGRFERWAAAYLATSRPAERAEGLAQGVAAARERRAVLHELIATDPERALRHAVPLAVRSGLPAEIQALLEARVDGIGAYHALAVLSPSAQAAPGFRSARRYVEIGGQTYEAFVYGRRLEAGSRPRAAIHGIALDGRLALMDSAVRVLDPGEPVAADRRVERVCAVSGEATEPATSPAAADTGDRVVYLCSAGHVRMLASQLDSDAPAAAEGDTAAAANHGVPAPMPIEGTRRVLMIRIRFADQAAGYEPETDASAAAMFSEADAFYRENSSGLLRIEGVVSPVYTLPQAAAWYVANDTSGYALNVLNAARAVAAAPQSAPGNEGLPAFNYLEFDYEAVRYDEGPGRFSGQGYVAMRGCWLKSRNAGVLIHELGHNLGLWHANAWKADDSFVPLGGGSNAEYGDIFDTMGPARGGAWHFNAWEKHRLGWLAGANVATVDADAVLTLASHDLGEPASGQTPRAIRVPRDDDRDYWIEFRRHPGWLEAQPDLHQGVGVRWDPWLRSNGGTQLLDMTPGSDAGRDDANLGLGRTFSDPAAGIHITPVAHASAGSAIEVVVHRGSFAGNRPPVVTVSSGAVEVAPGQLVQFTASASDPDGDALSYAWAFDDAAAPVSGHVVSRTWEEPGDHRARVTVSDRKGGTASASVLVRVGAAVGSRVSGRVMDLAGNPVQDALVDNGTEPGADGYRAAWSDADGSFTLLGVPPGAWTLRARKPGWIFAAERFLGSVVTPPDRGEVTLLGCWTGFSISGSVRGADGSPIAGALVRLGGQAEPTDQFGEFSLPGVAPGRYELTVTAGEAAFDPVNVEVGLADVDTVYVEEKTFTVAGTVSGGSLAAASVTTGWQSATVSMADAPSGTGRFTLHDVPAGTWSLRAVAPDRSYSPDGFIPPLVVAGDTSGIVLASDDQPYYAVSGTVWDRGTGVSGVTVSSGARSTVTDSRGGYWLAGLEAGTHEVHVAAPGLHFPVATRAVTIASAHVAGVDFSTDRLNQAPVLADGPRVVGETNQPFVTLESSADDDGGAGLLRYWWSVDNGSPGDVAFSATGAQAARRTIARFSAPGDYRIRVMAVDPQGATQSQDLLVTVRQGFGPPVLVEAARASPAVVGAGLETTLSVRATSELGDARLTYAWEALPADVSGDPSRLPGPVGFTRNFSADARETVARFRAPGNYLLRAVIRDPSGQFVESSVSVRVETTYASWLAQHFGPEIIANPDLRASVWGELADPDGDGAENLLEYAFATDPGAPSAEARPTTHFVTEAGVEYLAVSFRPNPDAIDLIYEPQVSSDLESWLPGLVFLPGEDERVVTYRDFSPATDHARRFIRVHVSRDESVP